MITITVNSEAETLDQPCSVEQYLAGRGLAGKRVAVELNGEIVPRSSHAAQQLSDGDSLEVIHAIGGG